MALLKVCSVLVLIYISQGAFALDITDRFPASGDRGSISELIPNFEDLRVEQKCEGKSADCSKYDNSKACINEGRDLGCFWSYK
jgi:hypothetical protein